MIRLALLVIVLTLSACAARTPPRPVGAPAADPTAIDAFTKATAACRGFRSLTGELALSGRAAGERIRGRVIAGLESGGSVRLEGVAPFGPPVMRFPSVTSLRPMRPEIGAVTRVNSTSSFA